MSDLKQTIYLRQSSSFGPWVECEKSHPDAVAFDRRTQPEATAPAAPTDALKEYSQRDLLMMHDLSRKLLWLAYVWNDHNFAAAHLEARRVAEAWGIKSFNDANRYLEKFTTPAQDLSAAILVLPLPTARYWMTGDSTDAGIDLQSSFERAKKICESNNESESNLQASDAKYVDPDWTPSEPEPVYTVNDMHALLKSAAALASSANALSAGDSQKALDALLTRIDDAFEAYERYGGICEFEGNPMIYADTLIEIVTLRGEYHAILQSQKGGSDE